MNILLFWGFFLRCYDANKVTTWGSTLDKGLWVNRKLSISENTIYH